MFPFYRSPTGIPDFSIDRAKFPADWIRWPLGAAPIKATYGSRGWLYRTLVAGWCPPASYPRLAPWPTLSADERWAAAVTRWKRAAAAIRARAADFPDVPAKVLGRISCCPPVGYQRTQVTPPPSVCLVSGCPFCYARQVGRLFDRLRKAYMRRPDGCKLWAAPLYASGSLKAAMAEVRRTQCAAGVLLHRPVWSRPGVFRSRGVLLADDRGRLAGRRPRRVRTQFALARMVARWLPYPRAWAAGGPVLGPARAMAVAAALPRRTALLTSLGAARDDYVAGKGWLDYAGYEPRG